MAESLDYFVPGDARLKRVYRANSAMEAEFVRGLLETEGIPAVVQGAALEATLSPLLGGTTLPSVCVRERDVEAALEVIERYEDGEMTQGTPWTCPNCGEEIEAQFTECWKCGTARGETTEPTPATPLDGSAADDGNGEAAEPTDPEDAPWGQSADDEDDVADGSKR